MHLLYIVPQFLCVNLIFGAENSALETKIVGGTVVKNRSEFAYQVSLRENGNHICGGTIIGPHSVLTAAHCVTNKGQAEPPSLFQVVAGDLNIFPTTQTVTRNVGNISVHEKYNYKTVENDVAVLNLTQSFGNWTDFIKPAPLATSLPEAGILCNISGWGTTSYSGSISPNLLFAKVPLLSDSYCKSSYTGAIYPGMICAGYETGNTDSCQGDSGGPLVYNGQLVGTVSWGEGCGLPNKPGVYSSVVYFNSWIKQHMNGSAPVTTPLINLFITIVLVLYCL